MGEFVVWSLLGVMGLFFMRARVRSRLNRISRLTCSPDDEQTGKVSSDDVRVFCSDDLHGTPAFEYTSWLKAQVDGPLLGSPHIYIYIQNVLVIAEEIMEVIFKTCRHEQMDG